MNLPYYFCSCPSQKENLLCLCLSNTLKIWINREESEMKFFLLLDNFLTPGMRQYSIGDFRVKWLVRFFNSYTYRQLLKGGKNVAPEFNFFYFQMLLKIRLLVKGHDHLPSSSDHINLTYFPWCIRNLEERKKRAGGGGRERFLQKGEWKKFSTESESCITVCEEMKVSVCPGH